MRVRNFSLIGVLMSSAAWLQPAAAQVAEVDATADEIIVTGRVSTFGATKSDIPILETARSVSVIEADKFLERGALTLDDTLAYTAGVVGDAFGFSTRGDFPLVRGLDVPEFLDNIQVLFGNFNNTRSDIYTLEQVEVLKGPTSVLYGQGSPGGIFNTISKKASVDYLEREIVLDYGTFDRFQVATDLGIDLTGNGAFTGRLVAVYRDSGTQLDFVEDDIFVIAPSLTFEDEMTRATVLVNYTDRESDVAHQFLPLSVTACGSDDVTISIDSVCAGASGREVDSSFYAGDPNFNRFNTESISVTGFIERQITDFLAFEATGRYRDGEADVQQAWVTFNLPGNPRVRPNGDIQARSWFRAPAGSEQYAVDARLRANFETGPISHEVLAGVNYQDVTTEQRRSSLAGFAALRFPTSFNVFDPVYDGSEIPSEEAFAAVEEFRSSQVESIGYYFNNQVTFGDFVLNAGVRFDDLEQMGEGEPSQDDDAVSFSAGILYKTAIGLNPYFSYAESFEPIIGVDNVTGDQLEPSEGKQFEVGLKYQPPGTRTYITAAYFDIEQTNLLDNTALPTEPSQFDGAAKVKGFEIEGQTSWGDFSLDASFSHLNTEDPDGVRFPTVPETQAAAWGVWAPSSNGLDGLRIGAGVRYAGGNESRGESVVLLPSTIPGIPFIPSPGVPFVVETEGYTVVDALIGYDFDFVSVTINARNLFDKEYYGTCLARGDCYPGERRTVVGRVALRF